MTTYEVSLEIDIPEYEDVIVEAMSIEEAEDKAVSLVEEMYREADTIEILEVKEIFNG